MNELLLQGRSPGSGAFGNLVHDVYPYFEFGHGIYLDQACSDVVVQNNVAYHTEGAVMCTSQSLAIASAGAC